MNKFRNDVSEIIYKSHEQTNIQKKKENQIRHNDNFACFVCLLAPRALARWLKSVRPAEEK